MTYRKKLIEVSLPLEAINKESAREKSIRHGHPSTLHLWWARRPLAACRAVLWSSLVDDPSEYISDEEKANEERERLFKILEELVLWENIKNEEVLDKARLEIARSVARDLGVPVPIGKEAIREFLATKAPPVLDPFAGGGSIPLEAQRLGLCAYASDLNPVAVLINKALIEIPPKFANMPPVHPPEDGVEKQGSLFAKQWKGAEGLAEDVRYYGQWMRDEAEKHIGHLYPKVKITAELLTERPDLREQGLNPGDELTVITWLWARTVTCPNPACGVQMPLIRSFALSTKKGKHAWIEASKSPSKASRVFFDVKVGKKANTDGTIGRNGARCIVCDTPVPLTYIRTEGQNGHLSQQLIAIVADTGRGRIFLPPNDEHEEIALNAIPSWKPDGELPRHHRNFQTPGYGMGNLGDLFTARQLITITTLSELIDNMREEILKVSQNNDYADAISIYLAFGINRICNTLTTIARWTPTRQQTVTAFSRQAIPMTWDYPDVNPFAGAAGDLKVSLDSIQKVLIALPANTQGFVKQVNATIGIEDITPIYSTDPPYYDNICYADLSDFFYVWLRKSLAEYMPDLFATVLVPKAAELIAAPNRFGGNKSKAEAFFENGLQKVFANIEKSSHKKVPITVFYAFKQTEDASKNDDDEDTLFDNSGNRASTGWETMLEGLISSRLQITGTWPMRSELSNRLVASGANALASSIVLVCRPRSSNANSVTRREFLNVLKRELPSSLRQLQQGSIAPVDLAQAAIGPGMSVFSRYAAVLEADGSPMRVRTALALINQALDEFLAEQEGEYDSDTRWALAWYEQYGHNEAPYGVAETLSKAKNTSVDGLVEAGFLKARTGKVRLLRRDELNPEWNPQKDKRPTAWEAVQHLIRALDKDGEQAAGSLLGAMGSLGESARDLAYRLYTVCERKSWAQDALGYNMLVVAWPRLKELAGRKEPGQGQLL